MSIIEKLTEGIVNRDMKKEGQALLNKWSATGLLEGLEGEQRKHIMARLLENQAKELLREASSLGAGDVEGFAAVAFPIVRRVFGGLIANDLVSIQPMSLPSGLLFYLDYTYGSNVGGDIGTNNAAYVKETSSIYGNPVNPGKNGSAEAVGGQFDLVGTGYTKKRAEKADKKKRKNVQKKQGGVERESIARPTSGEEGDSVLSVI